MFSTSGVSDTMMKMISAFTATSATERQACAPASTSTSIVTGRRPCTHSACPARRRFSAIGRPMIPSPMNPSFIAIVVAPYMK